MPRQYPAELRRQTCERMLAGEAVKDLTAELGIAGVTLYKWRRQALIDAGRRPGAKSYEADPLAAARRRVKELEFELKAVKAASALFEEGGLTQKQVPGCPRAEQPGLFGALRLSACRPRPLDLLRHQVPQAQRPRDPSSASRRCDRRHPRSLAGHLRHLAGQGGPRDRTRAHRQHQAGQADHA